MVDDKIGEMARRYHERKRAGGAGIDAGGGLGSLGKMDLPRRRESQSSFPTVPMTPEKIAELQKYLKDAAKRVFLPPIGCDDPQVGLGE
jgi:hypothetical protein